MMRLSLACLLVGGLTVFTGCTRESPKGGPGVKEKAPAAKETAAKDNVTSKKDTFNLNVPSGSTNITRGKEENVTISIDRGDSFTQNVKITFKDTKGLKITPTEKMIKTGETEARFVVTAEDAATVGDNVVTVVGTPDTGAPTEVNMTFDVKKKD